MKRKDAERDALLFVCFFIFHFFFPLNEKNRAGRIKSAGRNISGVFISFLHGSFLCFVCFSFFVLVCPYVRVCNKH